MPKKRHIDRNYFWLWFALSLWLLWSVVTVTIVRGQISIIGTGGNPYQVWVGDSLVESESFSERYKAIQYAINRGAWHKDSTIYIRRSEEYRITGFGDYKMLGQLLWEVKETPDSAYSFTWNSDSTAYATFTIKKKTP